MDYINWDLLNIISNLKSTDFIDIYIKNIPEFYKNSTLYIINLSNEKIQIPRELFVITKEINNFEDLYKMYKISIYWGMNFPDTFFLYLYFNKKEILLKDEMKSIDVIEDLKNTPNLTIKHQIVTTGKSAFLLELTTIFNKMIVKNSFDLKFNDKNLISICGGEYIEIDVFDNFIFCVENLEDFDKKICGYGCLFSFLNKNFLMSTYSFDKINGEINNRVHVKINKILKWYLSKIIKEIKQSITNKIFEKDKFNFFYGFEIFTPTFVQTNVHKL